MQKAEREYWKRQVEAVKTDAQVYKLMRWDKPRSAADPLPCRLTKSGGYLTRESKLVRYEIFSWRDRNRFGDE